MQWKYRASSLHSHLKTDVQQGKTTRYSASAEESNSRQNHTFKSRLRKCQVQNKATTLSQQNTFKPIRALTHPSAAAT